VSLLLAAIKILAAVLLCVALGRHPYGYYVLVRWVACGACIISAWSAFRRGSPAWAWFFVASGGVFNPVVPLHMSRSMWAVADLILGVLLVVSVGAVERLGLVGQEPN
jgi:hypothetical protein